MQEQNKLAAAGRRHPGTPASSTFDSAAMERQLRQVKGGGIAPAVQVIASRNMKPGGSMSNPAQHQNRSGVQAGVAAANAPAPPAPSNQILKCPRCSSFNTKFCYYNNYSLLQPRHFCKNCRRYWTKGGALRNVPVGGGCRKNKRVTGTTATANGSATDGASLMAMTTSAPSGAAKQSSMNMMIRENTAASCRNSSLTTAPMITNAVQKAALHESMPPQMHTHFPPLYSYTSKNCQIQPAISLSNSTPSFYNATDHSNLSQYSLLNPRLAPFIPPNQAASFHSFLNLKQALSSLASPNHSLISFNASLPPCSALPFLSNDHIATANLDAALQAPIDDPLMGLDLINASTTASLVPLPSLTTAHSTTTSSSLFKNNTSSGLALQQGFNHTNAHSNPAAVRQLKSIVPSSNDKKMNALYREDQQEVQAFGSSLSSRSACKDLQAIHAAAMQQEMHAASSKGLQDMQHAAAIMDQEGQLNMQIMSRSSSMKDELVSDNFKMKEDDNDHVHDNNQPVAGAICCTNAGWGGHRAQRSSFLEASGDDQPYWSCNPSTWHDDLST